MQDLELPEVGSLLEDKRIVVQSDKRKWESIKEAELRLRNALQKVVNEFLDLGVGELTNEKFYSVTCISTEGSLKQFVKKMLLETEGEIKIGNLRLKPDFIADGLAIKEVNELLAANREAQMAIYSSRSEFPGESHELVKGQVVVKESAMQRAFESCFLTIGKSNKKAKEVFELASDLADIQNRLKEMFPGMCNPHADMEQYIRVDASTGKVVPDGFAIRKAGKEE